MEKFESSLSNEESYVIWSNHRVIVLNSQYDFIGKVEEEDEIIKNVYYDIDNKILFVLAGSVIVAY